MGLANLAAHVETHLALSFFALAAACSAGVALGGTAAYVRPARGPVLALANVGRVIPSLAVLTFVLPTLGVGFWPAVVALILLGIPPIAINTDLGFRGVPASAIDAARGLGMTPRQVILRVAWPLALPVIFTGIRTATIEIVASATLAAFIGAGGLGEYILQGLANFDPAYLLTGAIGVSVLALLAEAVLAFAGRRLQGESR
ncbi:MAG: ABC transporter permease [Candidatus Eremiobacteraeota bacterium]|nr:ABC transporter permease [Candidatus Eremiobacteraeota bacterium]